MAVLFVQARDIQSEGFFALQSSLGKIKFLLQYAVLAPSTHNSQPWLFKIGESSVKIYFDPSKQIIEADPIGRDLYISFGCCLANLELASRYFNVYDHTADHGGREDNLIAEVFFRNLEKRTAVDSTLRHLVEAIPRRINARGIFEKRTPSGEIIKRMRLLDGFPGLELHFISDAEKIRQLASLTAEGLQIAYAKSSFRKEMAQWVHSSFSRKREGIPGYSLRISALLSVAFPTLVRFFNIGKRVGLLNYTSIVSAPLVCVISASENFFRTWLNVGRLFERIALEATANGLATSIFAAAIEMGELYRKVQAAISTNHIPQLLFCVGYMREIQKPNLRYSVEEKLIQ